MTSCGEASSVVPIILDENSFVIGSGTTREDKNVRVDVNSRIARRLCFGTVKSRRDRE